MDGNYMLGLFSLSRIITILLGSVTKQTDCGNLCESCIPEARRISIAKRVLMRERFGFRIGSRQLHFTGHIWRG